MLTIGCDFHTGYQQIAMVNADTGDLTERRLTHTHGEANAFYRCLPKPVRVGVEASGSLHWFEHQLVEMGHELWIGDAVSIRSREVRKQKTVSARDSRNRLVERLVEFAQCAEIILGQPKVGGAGRT